MQQRRARGPPVSTPTEGAALLRSNHLEGDRRDEVVAKANSRLVLTGRLDGRGDLDLALVDATETGGGDCISHIRGLDRAEQATALARLDGELDCRGLKACLQVLCLFEGCVLARCAGRLDGLDLLLATARPRHGEALGDEVVASETVLDVDDVAGGTET